MSRTPLRQVCVCCATWLPVLQAMCPLILNGASLDRARKQCGAFLTGFLGQVGPTANSVKEQAAPAAQAAKQQAAPAAQAVQAQAQAAPQAVADAVPDAASGSVSANAQTATERLSETLRKAAEVIQNPTAQQDVQQQIKSVTEAIPSPDQVLIHHCFAQAEG